MGVVDQEWNMQIDLNKYEEIKQKSYRDFENELNVFEVIKNLLIDKTKKLKNVGLTDNFSTKNNYEELKTLMEKNIQLKKDINAKVEDLCYQQKHKENLKKDRELLSQEIKEKHEGFLMAKKYYKKYLNIYFTIESKAKETQIVYLQFFTEVRKESDDYSIRIQRNTKNGKYELMSMKPKLDTFADLQKKLHRTNDLAELVCMTRLQFIAYKNQK